MNTRLKQFLAAENITQSQFADNIDVVRASVSHVLSGRNNPSYEFIKAIMARYPNLNMEWLMFGKGKMYKEPSGDTSPSLFKPTESVVSQEVHEDLLFNDLYQDDPADIGTQQEHDAVAPSSMHQSSSEGEVSPSAANIPITLLKDLVESTQQAVKQRKVTKIIVLFDDGSFQEL